MAQTTMKIDKSLLADLREFADNSYRSPQQQLRFMVDAARGELRSNKVVDNGLFTEMMDHLVDQSEAGQMGDAEQDYVKQLLDSGVK